MPWGQGKEGEKGKKDSLKVIICHLENCFGSVIYLVCSLE
jgi:hypothetical protein